MPTYGFSTSQMNWRYERQDTEATFDARQEKPKILESEPCGQLNLASGADGGEYSADVAGENARSIFEDGVTVPAQGERTLRVARDCEIRMIEQIVGLCSKRNFNGFLQLEALLQRQIKLPERGTTQDITPGISKP